MSSNLTAAILINDPAEAQPIVETLSRKGFTGVVHNDPEELLESCKVNPPDLVVVDNRLPDMTGIAFLARLVRISWTTGTILIIDEPEESVHDMAEGLGILGHMRHAADTGRLEELVDKCHRLRAS